MDAMALAQQQLLAQAAMADPALQQAALAQQQAMQLQHQQALQQQQLLQQQQQSMLVAQHQSAIAAQQQVKLRTDDGQNPKQVLHQFCTAFCGRALNRDDISYTVNKFGVQFQAIIRLGCLGGQEVVGHLCHNAVDAEKSAAMMCIEAYKDQIAAMPKDAMRLPEVTHQQPSIHTPATSNVDAAAIFAANAAKRARFQAQQAQVAGGELPQGAPDPETAAANAAASAMSQMQQMLAGGMGMGMMQQQQQQQLPQPQNIQPTGFTLPQSLSHKMQLNTLGMKIAKRILKHKETMYETRFQDGSYQTALKLAWLPDDWKEQMWVGDVASTKFAAEQSAAEKALIVLRGDEILFKRANEKVPYPPLDPVVRENPDPLGFHKVATVVAPPLAMQIANMQMLKGKMANGKDGGCDAWGKGKSKMGDGKGKMVDAMWGMADSWGGKGKVFQGGKGDPSWGGSKGLGKGDDSWAGGKGEDPWANGKGSKGEDLWGDGKGGKGDDAWVNGKGGKGDDAWGSSKGGESWGGDSGGSWSGKGDDSWGCKGDSGKGESWNASGESVGSEAEPWGSTGDSWNGKGESWNGKGKDSWSGGDGKSDSWSGKGKDSGSKADAWSSNGEDAWGAQGSDTWNGKGQSWQSKGDTWSDKGSSKGKFAKGEKGIVVKGKFTKGDIVVARTRLTDLPAYGEIIQFRDKFGWIKPAEEIQDDQGKTYDKLYFSAKDVSWDVQKEAGFLVQFHIYKDNAGVGAEDIKPL